MARTIGVVTVARSDYGHLVPLLEAFRDRSDVALQVYVAGAHLSPRFGRTVKAIEADGWPITERIETTGASDAAADVAAGAGAGVAGFARAFARGRVGSGEGSVLLLQQRGDVEADIVVVIHHALR